MNVRETRRRSIVRVLVLGSLLVGVGVVWDYGLFGAISPLDSAELPMVGSWQAEGDGWFRPLNPPLLYELMLTPDRRFVYRYDVRGASKSTSRGTWRAAGNTLFLKRHVPVWTYLRDCYRQRGLVTIPESKLRLEGDPPQLRGGEFPLERIEAVR